MEAKEPLWRGLYARTASRAGLSSPSLSKEVFAFQVSGLLGVFRDNRVGLAIEIVAN